MGSCKCNVSIVLLIIMAIVPIRKSVAQNISLQLEATSLLDNTQLVSFTDLGIDNEGSGPVLITGFIENLDPEPINDLFLEIKIRGTRSGTLVELRSLSDLPISLEPYQSLYITNNDIARKRIPGIDQRIDFSGGLTPEGENLFDRLSGSTTLPRDIYSVEVVIFKVSDAFGREDLARDVVEFGGSAARTFEESEIYLKSPGGQVGSRSEISNPYPQFSWEGENNISYRLVVVEQNRQDSPESLIESAFSTMPMNEGGSLLEYENLDVLVTQSTYQFPSSGAQPLQPGKTYYWQVQTSLQRSGDTERVSSEIWSFTLGGSVENVNAPPITSEAEDALIALIGENAYRQLQSEGFELTGIEYEGQEFTGPAATVKLEDILQLIRDKKLILGSN
ncbi:hypothetical protein ACKGJO_10370 [Gracilimonas sp. Q87]|uniref:hypothetical protein n=1 Tax=Gracilimonas sp. Q87 TaxID=3384766 RepID=UPI0039840CD7